MLHGGAGENSLTSARDRYVCELIRALWHPQRETRQMAAWILACKGAVQAAPALREVIWHFRETDPYTVAAAARALGAIGDARSVPVLEELLHGSYLVVRLAAVEALASIRTLDALHALQRALDDPSRSVREAAARVPGVKAAPPQAAPGCVSGEGDGLTRHEQPAGGRGLAGGRCARADPPGASL